MLAMLVERAGGGLTRRTDSECGKSGSGAIDGVVSMAAGSAAVVVVSQ